MNRSGIYVLYGDSNECLYVGRSKHMEDRVKSHRSTKRFTRAEYQPCPQSQLSAKERAAINNLHPTLNKMILRPMQNRRTFKNDDGETTKFTSINLTAADRQIVRKLQKQFEPEHGKQTMAGVIRIALRKAVR